MKGATTLDSVNTIKAPNKRRIMIIGNNQNFFLTFKNAHNSFNRSIPYLLKVSFITISVLKPTLFIGFPVCLLID